jgi:D-3-phosphoglycerate dehydrogenase
MKILIVESDSYSDHAIHLYKKLGEVILGIGNCVDRSSIDVLVIRLGLVFETELLATFSNLKSIVTATTGLNHISQTYCSENDIVITSLRDVQDEISEITSTSELALAMMLALVRNIPLAVRDVVDRGNWDRDRFVGTQLRGKTLGIIGVGRLGTHMVTYANALGMSCIGTDIEFREIDNLVLTDLPRLLEDSHVVSLHVSYSSCNHHLIGESEFMKMKNGAYFVNTSRGELVDEAAAVHALESGKLAGIAVDVLESENDGGSIRRSPLVLAAMRGLNVLVTPHLGGCTTEAMRQTEEIIARKFVSLVAA